MKTLTLNEVEFGKICARQIDKRIGTKLHIEEYPEKNCDIEIDFGVRWKIISEPEYDKFSGLKSFEGETRCEVTIYELTAFRNGDPEEVIFSWDELKSQIEYSL